MIKSNKMLPNESSHKEKPLSMFTLNLKVQPMKEINHDDTDNTMQKPSLFMAEYKSGPIKKRMEKMIYDTNNDKLE